MDTNFDFCDFSPLTGLVICSDCGRRLYHHQTWGYEIKPPKITKAGKTRRWTNAQDYYRCSTYGNSSGKFQTKCTGHYIRTAVLMELVLDTIKYTCRYAKENEEEFTAKVEEVFNIRRDSSLKGIKSDIAKKEKRSGELNHLISKIYEDNVSGKLSDKRFQMFLSDYEKEQEDVDNAILH